MYWAYLEYYESLYKSFHEQPNIDKLYWTILDTCILTITPLCCCPFAWEVWFRICQALRHQLPPLEQSVYAWWRRLRSTWNQQHMKGLDSLFGLVSWEIWKERNARCFREAASTVDELLLVIKSQADQWIQAGAKDLRSLALGGCSPLPTEVSKLYSKHVAPLGCRPGAGHL
jgi:hypothetical protein